MLERIERFIVVVCDARARAEAARCRTASTAVLVRGRRLEVASVAENAARILARTEMFSHVNPAILDLLADQAFVRFYRKGQPVFQEGDRGDQLFVVVEGLVKLTRTSSEGCPVLLAVRRPPDVFGEVGLVDGGPRLAAAEALRPTRLLMIPRDTFFFVASQHPALMEALLGSLGRLLRTALERGSDLVFLDLPARVAKALLELAGSGAETAGDVIPIDLTQAEVAAMAGGSRPAVNRILRGFEERGYLATEGRRLLVKQPAMLRRRAGLHEQLLPAFQGC